MNIIKFTAKWTYRFEQARARLLLGMTVLQILTFTAVWNFDVVQSTIFVIVTLIGVVVLGWGMDKIKFQHAYVNEAATRNPRMDEVLANQKIILEKLNIK